MKIDPTSDHPFHHSLQSSKGWDVISLSLVLNFVPDAQERGRMLRLAHALLAPDGLLFVVVSIGVHTYLQLTPPSLRSCHFLAY